MTSIGPADPDLPPDGLPRRQIYFGVAALGLAVASGVLVGLRVPAGVVLAPLLALSASAVFVIYSVQVFRWRTTSDRAHRPSVRIDLARALERVDEMSQSLNYSHAALFYQLLVEPSARIERITERVQPLIRSLNVTTTYSISVPSGVADGLMVLPILKQPKAVLIDGLRLNIGDGSSSSLTQEIGTAYAGAVIRQFLSRWTDAVGMQRYMQDIEPEVLKQIASGNPRRLARLRRRIRSIRGSESGRTYLAWAMQMIFELAANTFVAIPYRYTPNSARSPVPDLLRITGERRILVSRTRAGQSRYVRRGVALEQSTTSVDPLERGLEWARIVAGVQGSRFYFPLDNASQASSYHLEFRGPDGTYLAKQAIIEYPSGSAASVVDPELRFAMRPRQGQRHAHLYLRGGPGWASRFLMVNFAERMPGSMGPALLSSLATAIIILFTFIRREGPEVHGSDLIVILFAFPPLVAAWAGLDQSSGLRGGVLAARISTVSSIVLSCLAAALFLLPPVDAPVIPLPSADLEWLLVLSAALINLAGTAGSWLVRTLAQARFINGGIIR